MYIYRGEEVKKADERSVSSGMDIFTLMEVAGAGLFQQLQKEQDIRSGSFLVVAGKGNNGGDGIVLARYLKLAGADCTLSFPAGKPEAAAAVRHLSYYESIGFTAETAYQEKKADVIIDALLGAGTTLPLSESVSRVTGWINAQPARVVAVDMPTGTAADTGQCDPAAVQADSTYALHGFKPSCFLYPAAGRYGQTAVVDIGLPHEAAWCVSRPAAGSRSFAERGSNAHKGTFGHGLLIAGTAEMPGSAALAALGAVSCGAGKLTVQTESKTVPVIASHVPEAMYRFTGEVEPDHPFDAIAMGCGRAADKQMEAAVEQVLRQEKPVILDAGALAPRSYKAAACPVIVTPHPGEFSRMTGKPVQDIQANRLQEASSYAVEQKVTVVLKGEWTVIAFADGSGFVNPTGNEGLAKGGSGDTLTGMLLALLMRNASVKEAVKDAVYIHGRCADLWSRAYSAQSMRPLGIHELIPDAVREAGKEGQL